jgi:hypothetical protein
MGAPKKARLLRQKRGDTPRLQSNILGNVPLSAPDSSKFAPVNPQQKDQPSFPGGPMGLESSYGLPHTKISDGPCHSAPEWLW